jgi:hypothetical protein
MEKVAGDVTYRGELETNQQVRRPVVALQKYASHWVVGRYVIVSEVLSCPEAGLQAPEIKSA